MNGGEGREEGLGVADAVQKGQVQPTAEAVEMLDNELKLKLSWKESEREALRRKHLSRHY